MQGRVGSEKKVLNYYFVRYEVYYVNKQVVKEQEFFDYLKSHGVERNEAGVYSKRIENAEVYILLLYVENNIVADIFMNIY